MLLHDDLEEVLVLIDIKNVDYVLVVQDGKKADLGRNPATQMIRDPVFVVDLGFLDEFCDNLYPEKGKRSITYFSENQLDFQPDTFSIDIEVSL